MIWWAKWAPRPATRFGGLKMNDKSLKKRTKNRSDLQLASMSMNGIAAGSTLAFNILAGGLIGFLFGVKLGEQASLVGLAVGLFMGFLTGVDGLYRNHARY